MVLLFLIFIFLKDLWTVFSCLINLIYLKNSSIFRNGLPVYLLDCDVGQAECTPPGCVSLHRISAPLFGKKDIVVDYRLSLEICCLLRYENNQYNEEFFLLILL